MQVQMKRAVEDRRKKKQGDIDGRVAFLLKKQEGEI